MDYVILIHTTIATRVERETNNVNVNYMLCVNRIWTYFQKRYYLEGLSSVCHINSVGTYRITKLLKDNNSY